MTRQVARQYDALDAEIAEHVGGMSCPPTDFERWVARNPTRRRCGFVVVGGKELFDWRVAREQTRVDFLRWRRSMQRAPVTAPARRPARSRVVRTRVVRSVATANATADPDGEPPSAASSDAIGGDL